ncbi:MAG: hypothetical protein QNJ13_09830 [Paracoccaceae bacterium]|nr:hypothetical protein [Paracoccaceae bacterium]
MRSTLTFVALTALATPAFADVTAIADLPRNQPVTVAGTVERFHDEDEIRLTDETGSVRVYLGPQPVALDLGQKVEVTGFLEGDLIGREIYAREIVMEDGTVIAIDSRYE